MARLNRKTETHLSEETHEGAPAYGAKNLSPIKQLRRSVMSCFLWEDTFYEDGEDIATRIAKLVAKCDARDVANLAIEARVEGHLRHVPLLLLACLEGQKSKILADTISVVISRADELSEFLAVYAKVNKVDPKNVRKKISKQVKLGLARAFSKFDEYSFAKYNREADIKLRDVMFMVHPKPGDKKRAKLYKAIAEDRLKTPDTWEVALSSGKGKKATFERLLEENNLGAFALLRNLRNMEQAGVNPSLIEARLLGKPGLERARGFDKILPFRYVAAARNCVPFEPMIDKALLACINNSEPLEGRTVVLVDVSGSMEGKLSAKSDLRRVDAAAALASVIKGDHLDVFTFDTDVRRVPARLGMAGIDAICQNVGGGTDLERAISHVHKNVEYDRLIVITDEQSSTRVPAPKGRGYMINVASYKNGVGYGPWVHIDGFSERVINFIHEYESE